MKKFTKKAVAVAAATIMSCTMMTAWANTASITKIEVTNTTGDKVLWSYDSNALAAEGTTIKADSSNLVKVYTKIVDAQSAGVEGVDSTFLSHLENAQTVDNETIQFVDQKLTDATGAAVYTFRPRTNYTGTYLAKTGGRDVAAVSEKYTVGTAEIQWTLAGQNNNVAIGSTDNLVFNFTLPTNAVMPTELASVKINDTDTTAYTYDATAKTLTLTSGYPVAASTTYTVKVSAAGYTDATASYVVAAPEVDPIQPGDEATVEEGVKDALGTNANPTISGNTGTITLGSGTITGEDTSYNVNYSLVGASAAASIENGTITYDFTQMGENVIAETVTVKASVGSKETTKKFFFVKPGVTLEFGNVNASTAEGGTVDVFGSQEKLATVAEADALEIRAQVLNIVYNQDKKDGAAQWAATLDYDRNGTVTLGEYYIVKRMLDEKASEHEVYNVTNIKNSRPATGNN